jgi:histidinol-phosphate/aromatic aminotransferase/cobyric acid decarboxylase-like protein
LGVVTVHGGDIERIARDLGVDPDSLLDLSVSLNPVGPDVAALAAAHLGSLRRYPDPTEGTRLLAGAIGVETECLLLTNGGAEAIALLGEELGGRVDEPEFSLHPRGPAAAPLWRSNPHNPTGRLAGPDERADVWDEAFYPLTGRWTAADLRATAGVLRATAADLLATAVVASLTKVFGCPGLRLGYVIAAPDLIVRVAARQPEWSVGTLALAVLPELLQRADLTGWARDIACLRRRLTGLLAEHGLSPQPSDVNYLLCGAPPGFRGKLMRHGIVVRDCTSFGLTGVVRIAVPDDEGIERLSAVLDEVMS